MDSEQFNKHLEQLRLKYPIPTPLQIIFTQIALKNFCIDLADFVNGILPALNKSFGHFYDTISCNITGDKIDNVMVFSDNNCQELLPSFEELDPPASIQLRFTLQNSKPVAGLLTIYKDISVNFRPEGFEVVYNDPTTNPVPLQKEYNSNLLDISRQLLDRLSQDFLTTLLNRT